MYFNCCEVVVACIKNSSCLGRRRLKTCWRCPARCLPRRFEDVLKMSCEVSICNTSWRRLRRRKIVTLKTSWRRLEDVFKTPFQDVFKTFLKESWRRLGQTFWRRLEDVSLRRICWSWSRRLADVFWRLMIKGNILFLIKTSSEDEDQRRLQDVFKTSSPRRMFAGLLMLRPVIINYFSGQHKN